MDDGGSVCNIHRFVLTVMIVGDITHHVGNVDFECDDCCCPNRVIYSAI